MIKSSERWSLSKSFHSKGNQSAALTERFLQTLRKQNNKPLFPPKSNKQTTRKFKLSIREEPNHHLPKKRKIKVNSQERDSLSFRLRQRLSTNKPYRNKLNIQQKRICQLKQQFLRLLGRKESLKSMTVTLTEIKLCISGMIVSCTHRYFQQIFQSIVQMMSVQSNNMSAINLFIILLGFQNISLTQEDLNIIIPNFQNYDEVINLSQEEVNQMFGLFQYLKIHQHYSEYNPLIISITLPNKQKQDNLFSGKENFKQIATNLMCKYNIPNNKKKRVEKILFSKLKQKKLI